MTFGSFFAGLAIALIGFLIIKFAYQINNQFLRFSWGNLNEAGYKILGILIIILAAFVMFGLLSSSPQLP